MSLIHFIIYSSSAINTHSKKKTVHTVPQNGEIQHGAETHDSLHFFTLPKTLDGEDIDQLLQNNTSGSKLTQCSDRMVQY